MQHTMTYTILFILPYFIKKKVGYDLLTWTHMDWDLLFENPCFKELIFRSVNFGVYGILSEVVLPIYAPSQQSIRFIFPHHCQWKLEMSDLELSDF